MKPIFILEAFPALGTLWWLEIFDKISNEDIKNLDKKLKEEIVSFENTYSRFLKNSETSRLNLYRQLDNPTQDFYEMCKLGFKYSEITDGIFNLCVGGILEKRGYGNIFEKEFLKEELLDMREILQISPSKISLIKDGYNIDFGGLGKGYLIDKIKTILQNYQIKYFLINGGGDIFASTIFGEPFEIFIEDPVNQNTYIGKILLENSGLGVSSPYKRVWVGKSGEQHHLISNNLKSKIYSSFVVSESILASDVFATCLCIDPYILKNNKNLVESYLVLDEENFVEVNYNFKIYD